jgi:hypothetical protein
MKKFSLHFIAFTFVFTASYAVTPEYGVNTYEHQVGSGRIVVSVPTLHGQEIPVLRGIVVRRPGDGQSTAAAADPRLHKWLYEHGLAFWGSVGFGQMTPTLLASFGADYLPARPEFPNLPIMIYGASSGGDQSVITAYDYPQRVIAAAPEHSRHFLRSRGPFVDPPYPVSILGVPIYFRWGEWDWNRFDEGYRDKLLPTMAQGPHQWMFAYEARLVHALETYATEETLPYFHWMMEHRYDYQPGVVGKDPALGPVNLIPLTTEHGWLGEQNFGPSQNALGAGVVNFAKDWESADPHLAPFGQFEREESDKRFHSWMPDPRVAAFWATKSSHGNFDLHVEFPDMIDEDLIRAAVRERGSIFPNYFNTAQSARMSVEPIDFPGTVRVDFYANEQLVASVDAPPYEHDYNFADLGPGMFALYAAAVTDEGLRSLSRRRVVQVYSDTRGANTAPTISRVDPVGVYPGTSVAVPFTVGDAETPAENLTVSFTEVNRSKSVAAGSYSVSFGGSGTHRSLNFSAPTTPGVIWGIIHVSDGDISTNAYVTFNIRGDGTSAPFFVEAAVSPGPVFPANAWSRRISVPVYDFDTDVRDLVLTAEANSAAYNGNLRVGGAGRYRYVQVKHTAGLTGVTLRLSDGHSEVTTSFSVSSRTLENQAPILSAIPDQTLAAGHVSAPIRVRLHDIHHNGEAWIPSDQVLTLSAVSDNESILPQENIHIFEVGPHRDIVLRPLAGQSGVVNVTATATDPGGLSRSHTFQVTVVAPAPLALTAQQLPAATLGSSYNAPLAAEGGAPPLQWSLASGSLPPGLTLDADGWLSGTPTTPGTYSFTVQVTDSGNVSQTASVQVPVRADLSAPQDVTATARVDGGVDLVWTDLATGETGFEIQRRGSDSYAWVTLPPVAADAGTFTDPGLTPSLFYEYRIRAVTADSAGAWSRVAIVQAMGQPVILENPQSQTFVYGVAPVLQVLATGGQLNYQWYLGNPGDVSQPLPGEIAPQLQLPALQEPEVYWVRVHNLVGFADSPAVTLTPTAMTWPVLIDFGTVSTASPDVLGRHWNSMTVWNINTKLSHLLSHDGHPSPLSVTIGTWTFYFDTQGLANDSLYPSSAQSDSFYVSHPNSGDVVIAGLTPHATYDLTVFASRSSHDVVVSPFIAHYSAEGVSGTLHAANNVNQSVTLSAVQSRADGTIVLNVSTEDGQHTNRGHIGVLELHAAGPGIITQPVGTIIQEGENHILSVLAAANEGALTYQWYRGESGDESQPISGADAATFDTGPLDSVGQFPYWVNVSDDLGSIASATAVVEILLSEPPAMIEDVTITDIGNSQVTLTWSATGAHGTDGTAQSYEIRYSRTPIDSEEAWLAATVVANPPAPSASGTIQSFTIPNLWPGHGYYFAIRAINSAGVGTISNIVAVMTDPHAEIYHQLLDPNAINVMGTEWTEVVDTARVTSGHIQSHSSSIHLPFARNWNEDGAQLTGASGSAIRFRMRQNLSVYQPAHGANSITNATCWHILNGAVNPNTPSQRALMPQTGDLAAIFHDGRLNIHRSAMRVSSRYLVDWGDGQGVQPEDNYLELVLDNLPEGRYDLTFGLQGSNRIHYNSNTRLWEQEAMFEDAHTKVTLQNVTVFTHASSPGIAYPEGMQSSAVLMNPDNPQGAVARWTGIEPVDGTIVVRFQKRDDWQNFVSGPISAENAPQSIYFYTPQLMRLRYEGPDILPTITAQPLNVGIVEGAAAILSVQAEAGFGPLTYQWYAGEAGDRSQPVHGANGATATLGGLDLGTHSFWVEVMDMAGSVESNSVQVVVMENDTVPPDAIDDLRIPIAHQTRVRLVWTAPYDEGSGTVSYSIRYSENPLTEANFASAEAVDSPPLPAEPGTLQTLEVSGLRGATSYYFAIKTTDAFGNVSALSNVAQVTTRAPAGILIEDFNTGGGVHFGSTWNHGTTTSGWRGNPSSAASGFLTHRASGGNAEGFARFHRASWTNAQSLSIWLNRNAFGIEAGKTYTLAFDYRVDRQGTTYSAGGGSLRYSVGQRTVNAYVEGRDLITSTGPTFSNDSASWVVRHQNGPVVTAATQWLSYQSTQPIVFDAASDLLFFTLRAHGFGIPGTTTNWEEVTDFTWLGIDNIRLIPVEAPPAGYAGWVANYGLTGPHAERNAKPFGDMPNLLKFAFGLPGNTAAGPEMNPTAELNRQHGTLDFRFMRHQQDLSYIVEGCENLIHPNWEPLAHNPGEAGAEVTVPVSLEGREILFLRLRVEED